MDDVRAYPFSPPHKLDLDPNYQTLQEGPLTKVKLPYGEQAWLATRYADVRLVLGDPRFSRAMALGRDEPRMTPQALALGIMAMDAPEHTRLRGLIARAFTTRRVEELRPKAIEFAEDLAGDMVKHGAPADLVSEFATPLPVRVLCQLLGVPITDQDKFHVWSEVFVSATSLPLDTIVEYLENLNNYMADLVEQRRREPRDDLISALVKARDENNDRLTENEMVELAAGLLAAGHDTTVNQIPNCVYVLLANRDRWEELRADPSLIPAAVEELMRFIPLGVAAAFARYATEDIEVGGVLVKAGEPVLASTASANRDERAFPEPHRIDFRRQAPPPHLGFGHGVHHCVGAALARMELQVTLRTLLSRFPRLAFAVPESGLEWKKGLLVRGLKELPVTW